MVLLLEYNIFVLFPPLLLCYDDITLLSIWKNNFHLADNKPGKSYQPLNNSFISRVCKHPSNHLATTYIKFKVLWTFIMLQKISILDK